MKKVALLTTFMDLPSGYGLVPVVLDQLQLLTDKGYTPGLFVVKGFEEHSDMKKIPSGVIIEPHVPFLHLFDYSVGTKKQIHRVDAKGQLTKKGPLTNFDRQVSEIESKLEPELIKYEVIITHDIIFQTWFLVHNQAIRNIAERHPELRWIHWIHSGPSPRPEKISSPHHLRFSDMTNSVWVSPNESMIPKFAEMYNVSRRKIRCVYHVFDPLSFFNMNIKSQYLIRRHDLLNCDVLCVWATRIDHPKGKGLKYAVWLTAQMNKLVEAKLVFLNSWSRTEDAKNTIAMLKREAEKWGMPNDNLIFSSEEGVDWELGVSREVVRDLLMISNLFILPSQSETFSFAMAEAAICKNLLVLNRDLSVLVELAEDDALYSGFGSEWGGTKISRRYEPNPQKFFLDEATRILAELKNNKSLMAQRRFLRKFNRERIWREQFRPLIED